MPAEKRPRCSRRSEGRASGSANALPSCALGPHGPRGTRPRHSRASQQDGSVLTELAQRLGLDCGTSSCGETSLLSYFFL